MARRAYIVDLKPNELIEGLFAIQNAQMGLTKNGKPFLKCLIADKTGRAPGRMWNATEELIRTLPTDGFVYIEGQTQPYQGEMQIILNQVAAAEPSTDDLLHLLPCTKFDIDTMFSEVVQLLGSLSSPSLKALAQTYLEDADLMERFKRAPAAVQLHHAYLGGLLEHTLGLMRLAEAVLPSYPGVSRDLTLMGLFLHDLGKCEELSWESGFSYSDSGNLVGHIARGVVWLNQKAQLCAERGHHLPTAALHVLEHIILSHHGLPEYGALKIPSTPEAILVHQLDNLDAKMQMVNTAADRDSDQRQELGGAFTEKIWALNTRVYRPDPLADEQATSTSDANKTKDGLF